MGLNDFGNGHPVGDFTGKPRVIFGVPHINNRIIPSDNLQSFNVGNQHGFALLGHLVLGSYPGHGLGVFGLEDATEQGPVDGPRLDGFGAVGAGTVHALLADVDLPAAKIGGGWFHGFRGWGVRQICELLVISKDRKYLVKIWLIDSYYIYIVNRF